MKDDRPYLQHILAAIRQGIEDLLDRD